MFSLLFLCVASTLKNFGLNPKKLGAEIGMTMVLHTHSRKLDFHPMFMLLFLVAALINTDVNGKRKKRDTYFIIKL